MTRTRRLLLLLPAACAVSAWSAPAGREPHIGYLYPAGGRQGTSVEITVGGQFLRGVTDVYVSGKGVTASVVQHYRPVRNLQKEQRQELQRRLKELKEKRLSELPDKDSRQSFRLPGERFVRKGRGKRKREAKADGEAMMEVTLPEHPLLRDLEKKSLRELYQVADAFFNFRSSKKKQQNAQIAEMVLIKVEFDRTAPPGDRELRLATPLAVTNPMCFQVSNLAEAREEEPNDPGAVSPLPAPTPLDLPVLMNGQIMPGDVDRFRFRAKQGQKLVIQAHARRLVPFLADAVPGWFQATVAVYDSDGKEVAFADDYRFDPDPVMLWHVPKSGEYELEVRDSIYRGREDFVYRVAVGELPFVTQVFPLGGLEGAKTVAAIDGWNLSRKRLHLNTKPGAQRIRHTALRQGKSFSNEVTYAVDALPDCKEAEPNDDIASAQPIELPRIVNGRIGRPGDVDVFRFGGRAGDEVVAEVQARRLRSPLDSLLRLTDAAGKVLEWNDDNVRKEGHLHTDMGFLTHHADSYLKARLPADGSYFVHLADTRGQGGTAHAYRLRISQPRPDFVLRVTPSSLSVPAGRVAAVTVHAMRKDGFEGDIELTIPGAPPGFVLSGGRIPAGRDRVRVTLTAPSKAPDAPVALNLQGHTLFDGKPVRRRAIPSEDVMQAFLWRHLAPSRELLVSVTKSRWNALPVQLADSTPVRIPAGGSAKVRVKTPRFARQRKIELKLREPVDGLSLSAVKPVPDGLAFQLNVAGDSMEPGYADNLIVEAFGEFAAPKRGKKKGGKGRAGGGKKRRVSLGVLPAIAFEVVQR